MAVMTGTVMPGAAAAIRRGPSHWLSSYAAMLRFDLAAQRNWLPMFATMQVMFGAGMAVIYGFYIGHLPPGAALYIVSGSPALAVLTAGLIGVTMLVTQRQQEGTWDFVWSLPAPRSAAVAATFTVLTLLAVPGIVITLALAAWRYGITLDVSFMAVPALLLSALMTTSVGFGMALLIGKPVVTNAIVNALIFVVLIFSPVQFPIGRLPGWLAGLHRVLPVYHLGQVLRASVTRGLVADVGVSYAVLGGWTAAAWLATAWVVGRRR
jgi:ABC-2 type transport system permease protein